MKKKTLIYTLLAVAAMGQAGAVYATSCDWCEPVNNQASAAASASASSSAGAAAIQGQSQSTTVNNTVNNVQPSEVRHSGEYTVKDTPAVIGGTHAPSALCHGTSSVGLSLAGFGISVGSSWRDEECQIIQSAMSLMALGMRDDAIAVMCQVKHMHVAPVCAPHVPKPVSETGSQ